MPLSRREALRAGAAVLGALVLDARRTRAAEERAAEVFPLSVASGDPTPSGAVVWTRIAPEAAATGRDLALEVATDPDFRDRVVTERIPSRDVGAERDFTVRLDLDGRLGADRRYFYRFVHGGVTSRTGRLRTLPAPDAEPQILRIALASCQDYTRGYFNAYDHVARQELDFILHVGDFLYESLAPEKSIPARRIELPSGGRIVRDLRDYRAIHRAYRSDPAIQRAFERHTLVAIWDDHDVANDRYWDPVARRLRAPDHPLDADPAASDALHSGGIRAWSEYVPGRARYDAAAASPRDRLRIERSLRFGKLAELFLTDTRLRRDPHPCGEKGTGERFYRMDATCPGRTAAGRTMLGEEQRQWLVRGITRSDARWKLLGTSVPLTPVGYGSGPGRMFLTLDTWTGYEHERRAILQELASRGVRNLVSLTGDMHTFFAARIHADEPDPLKEGSRPVGVELATGALAAARLGEITGPIGQPAVVLPNNPQIAFWNALANGYSYVEITPDVTLYEPRGFAIDRVLEGADAEVLGRFEVRAGAADVVERRAG